MDTVQTPKGTILPLVNLKGKDYLMVAYRIQWMNEEVPKFDIETELLTATENETVARAKVTLYNEQGEKIKSATATKRETKRDFGDHLEKSETSAVGRALAMLGFGTQFALADLDEGERLADSPLVKSEGGIRNPQVTERQIKFLYSLCKEKGWDQVRLIGYMKGKFNKDKANSLTNNELQDIVRHLNETLQG